MYRRICSLLLLSAAFAAGCRSTDTTAVSTYAEAAVLCEKVLPVTGTFLNLAYQDVRNKYTNPPAVDYTDPLLWHAKVDEMKNNYILELAWLWQWLPERQRQCVAER